MNSFLVKTVILLDIITIILFLIFYAQSEYNYGTYREDLKKNENYGYWSATHNIIFVLEGSFTWKINLGQSIFSLLLNLSAVHFFSWIVGLFFFVNQCQDGPGGGITACYQINSPLTVTTLLHIHLFTILYIASFIHFSYRLSNGVRAEEQQNYQTAPNPEP